MTDDKLRRWGRSISVICNLSSVMRTSLRRVRFWFAILLCSLALWLLSTGLRLEQSGFIWSHEEHGSFIRGESADVSLLFDSCARRWTLRIYKRQTSFGDPVTYEIAFKERYGPTVEQAIALANDILLVELQ